ncbi:MAG: alpha/beta fold hydrolase [Bacteroidetes bacterium]|nr:alpha/beta fold hydrolase [Bacteroidota bacterium]
MTIMKFDIDKDLFPFQNNFLHLDDETTIHYIDEGEGPVLLMLHGNPTWSFLYRKMIAELKGDFRIIAPDYPGFGLSPTPMNYDFLPSTHSEIINAFINQLELKDIILVMQDWGGPIGLNIATQRPELIRGMVIGNTWAWPFEGFRNKSFSWVMGGPIGQWMARSFNGVWHVFMQKGFIESPSQAELAMYKAPFLKKENRIQTSIFPRELVQSFEFESKIESSLHKLKEKPVLFTWGSKDFAFKEKELNRFKMLFPHHRVELLNASHFWQDEKGEVAAQFLIEWAKDQGWIDKKP